MHRRNPDLDCAHVESALFCTYAAHLILRTPVCLVQEPGLSSSLSTCRPQPQGPCPRASWHEARAHGRKHLGGLSHKACALHAPWHEARAHGLKQLGCLSHKACALHALWHEAQAHGLSTWGASDTRPPPLLALWHKVRASGAPHSHLPERDPQAESL
jgi:hypothetical protein